MKGTVASSTNDFAQLLSAIASLISAVAWPLIVISVFLIFRRQIYKSVSELSSKMDSATAIKFPFFEIAFVKTELGVIAAKSNSNSGDITKEQIEASVKIEAGVQSIDKNIIVSEMKKLCREYDMVRGDLPSGFDRTKVMNQIIAKMRSLGPSVAQNVEAFMCSTSPGERLAAIAIMQMSPATADVQWLLTRFSNEQPFLFYNSAIALKNLLRSSDVYKSTLAKNAANKALDALAQFPGEKDVHTISVLEAIVNYR